MGGEGWNLTAKLCDSCKASPARLFCRSDSAFLCMGCDSKIHAANKLASRHPRVWMCEVCEQAPASVTCKADAAALCVACDRDIHSANPLARRHERFPVVPFYDSSPVALKNHHVQRHAEDDDESTTTDKYFSDHLEGGGTGAEEAEAASWLLPNPNVQNKMVNDVFSDMDAYLDTDLMSAGNQKQKNTTQKYSSAAADRVVPEQMSNENNLCFLHHLPPPQVQEGHPAVVVVDGFPTANYDNNTDYFGSNKPVMYNFTSQSISQSVSSSSVEVGVVPDHNSMADVISNTNPITGLDREARVLRYREKRKNRKFEKTIRYASRKAYAETRPRIKGRFAKRSEMEVESLINADASYSVVPTY